MENSDILNLDIIYMRMAVIEARLAGAEGEVPVGAVLVGPDGAVVVRTRNRKETTGDPTAHAETLAVREGAAAAGWRLSGHTLYVTKEPCVMCAGAILNARVGRLVFGCVDFKGGAVRSLYTLLEDPRLNHRVSVASGVLEDECAALLREFFGALRGAQGRSGGAPGK
jgi:tRNA(adenine34) deaminase